MTLRYVSVCSGIESATVAWHPLGFKPLLFAEIAKFPSAVLAHHYPSVPNVGDFTSIQARSDCDLLVGGTPCQAFSIAGLRGGLSDARGNLALEYLRLADRLRARWLLWENVPGVLSSNGGRDFGSILGALAELGYGFAWRVLDAQFLGVPQRRRRVFLVGYLGDWRRAAAVLFERSSLRRDTPKKRAARDQIAGTLGAGSEGGGFGGDLDRCGAFVPVPGGGVSVAKVAAAQRVVGVHGSIAHTLRAEGCDASEDGTGRGTPVVAFAQNSRDECRLMDVAPALTGGGGKPGQGYPAICFGSKGAGHDAGEIAPTLRSSPQLPLREKGGAPPAIAFHATQDPISGSVSPALKARGMIGVCRSAPGGEGPALSIMGRVFKAGDPTMDNFVTDGWRVRRLTPLECERLQGFPDGYTAIPGATDTGRYHALGNSMAVPCMRWIGERLALVDRYAGKVEADAVRRSISPKAA